MNVGAPELLIVLTIAIVVFGAGRVGDLGGALGKGIREFRAATRPEPEPPQPLEARTIPVTCSTCGTTAMSGQRFCGACGTCGAALDSSPAAR